MTTMWLKAFTAGALSACEIAGEVMMAAKANIVFRMFMMSPREFKDNRPY